MYLRIFSRSGPRVALVSGLEQRAGLGRSKGCSLLLCVLLILSARTGSARAQEPGNTLPEINAGAGSGTSAPGTPFTAEVLSSLLPASVYFQGRTAALQLRNAGGTAFAGGAEVWAALVDTSGYSSAVQERYQFYLVSEGPLRVGDASLPAGTYGGGFLQDRFVIMDVGGHTVAEGRTELDETLKRPRPLQVLPADAKSVRLYLGRRWVALQAATAGPR